VTELSDYRRIVEAPMIADYKATIKALRASLALERARADTACAEAQSHREALNYQASHFAAYRDRAEAAEARADTLTRERDAVRAAAERVVWFDWSGNDPDAVSAIDALRALLDASGRGQEGERSEIPDDRREDREAGGDPNANLDPVHRRDGPA
jgi:hypothetical protein